MAAIDWIRSKATQVQQYVLPISAEQAAASEIEPGNYRATQWKFEGTVPYRMAKELQGATLVNTDMENETLRVGGEYRSEAGRCLYYRTVYEKEA